LCPAVEEDVGGVEGHVVARHVPDALVEAALAPGVLHQIIRLALFVDGLAVDQHHVVVSESPVVPLLLSQLLRGRDAVGQHGQSGAGEIARHVAAPGYGVTGVNRRVDHFHQLFNRNVVTGFESPFVG